MPNPSASRVVNIADATDPTRLAKVNADGSFNATSLQNEWQPADQGYISWAYDPSLAATNTVLSSDGLLYTVKLKVRAAVSITNVVLIVTSAGVGLTVGQCIAGLYQNGALLGSSADQSTAWLTQGEKTMALVGGAVPVIAGEVVVAWYSNGGTKPGFSRTTNTGSMVNAGTATTRFGNADSGRTTTLPAALGAISGISLNYWAAIS